MTGLRFYENILCLHNGEQTRTIYVGVTSNLEGRVLQHKSGTVEAFAKKYGLDKLVYYEEFSSSYSAIEREKQVKAWRRSKKVKLIKSQNPKWLDLAADWQQN